ncbi:hypothetical protein [Bradyrhizobium sp. NC92]|uniref:pPIWI-associating nuclease domain-containing protein n=1 Tax=Bradyrhizobium sp. (strain NC92) TaxID=55395 RepID=UPI0021A9E5DB|nr:hypothetical protein [Bradyrhizobium sp. NC92]UWU66103.1 hypothetical protein N2602_22905 [Bradyrhizobium sp. NC92]
MDDGAKNQALPSWPELRQRGDAFLREIPQDDFAATVLAGAFQVGESKNPIRGNLCAAAIREVAGHVLHALAPDSRVSKCCWYEQEPKTNGPTRQQRAIYIVQGGLPIDFVTNTLKLDHKAVCRPLIKAIDRLNRATHVREETILTDDKEIRRLVDEALSGLLDVFAATRECQEEVHKQLADEIHDAVFDTFLTETLQELDELSTHTTVDDHYVSEVRVLNVDEEFINIVANGTVYVELQYGSGSDLRNDMGAVISDSYPYSARMKSKVRSASEIIKDTVVVSVDNRSFYE